MLKPGRILIWPVRSGSVLLVAELCCVYVELEIIEEIPMIHYNVSSSELARLNRDL